MSADRMAKSRARRRALEQTEAAGGAVLSHDLIVIREGVVWGWTYGTGWTRIL